MFHSIRLASPNVDYPLPVAGPARWHGGEDPVRLDLPDIPAQHIVVASFACRPACGSFRFRLAAAGGHADTAWFGPHGAGREGNVAGGQGPRRPATAHGDRGKPWPAVTVPVDYFHTRTALAAPVLSLRCAGPPPRDHLLCVAIRPGRVAAPRGAPEDTPIAPAPRLSQTTVAEADRPRACSPTATAMAIGIGDAAALRDLVDLARHQASGLLGVWPQNIWAAARRGRLGAVELIAHWDTVRQVLANAQQHAAGHDGGRPAPPLVASLRFKRGELPGSPLPSSGGHLVTVRGIENGAVVAHDPAAAPPNVLRRYDAAPFAKAWMRHRGAAYVFAREPANA